MYWRDIRTTEEQTLKKSSKILKSKNYPILCTLQNVINRFQTWWPMLLEIKYFSVYATQCLSVLNKMDGAMVKDGDIILEDIFFGH